MSRSKALWRSLGPLNKLIYVVSYLVYSMLFRFEFHSIGCPQQSI